jgi:hypothetical protein
MNYVKLLAAHDMLAEANAELQRRNDLMIGALVFAREALAKAMPIATHDLEADLRHHAARYAVIAALQAAGVK